EWAAAVTELVPDEVTEEPPTSAQEAAAEEDAAAVERAAAEAAADEAAADEPRGEAAPIELTGATLEALLFGAERPLTRREIAGLARTDIETVDARLGDLEMSLAGRGIRLVLSEDRVELATAPEAGELIARHVGAESVPRLSQAALETLAIVAY